MKKYILLPFVSMLLLGATNSYAQDKNDDENSSSKECCHKEFSCYKAWKKDMKRQKKLCLAEEMECYRPFAAERKRRKACKKAWKRDILEQSHNTAGWGHDYWW
jgi:hypothetical protein